MNPEGLSAVISVCAESVLGCHVDVNIFQLSTGNSMEPLKRVYLIPLLNQCKSGGSGKKENECEWNKLLKKIQSFIISIIINPLSAGGYF